MKPGLDENPDLRHTILVDTLPQALKPTGRVIGVLRTKIEIHIHSTQRSEGCNHTVHSVDTASIVIMVIIIQELYGYTVGFHRV